MVRPLITDSRCFACHGPGAKVVGVLNLNYSLGEMMSRIRETSQSYNFV